MALTLKSPALRQLCKAWIHSSETVGRDLVSGVLEGILPSILPPVGTTHASRIPRSRQLGKSVAISQSNRCRSVLQNGVGQDSDDTTQVAGEDDN